jgi:putative component of toxin-antitoxin plasmid stabilization module
MPFCPSYHVYYGLDGVEVIVLLCGDDKSTQRPTSLLDD